MYHELNRKKELITTSLLGAVQVLAFFGIIDFFSDFSIIGLFNKDYIPMPLICAVHFTIINLMLINILDKHVTKQRLRLHAILTILLMLFSLFNVIRYLVNTFSSTLFIPLHEIFSLPPSTSVLFFIMESLILMEIIILYHPMVHNRLRLISNWLSYFYAFNSLALCLSYIFGSPLLRGDGLFLPVTLPTALASFLLANHYRLSHPDTFPINIFYGKTTKNLIMQSFIPYTIVTVLISSIFIYMSHHSTIINPALSSSFLIVCFVIIGFFVTNIIARKLGNELDLSIIQEVHAKNTAIEKEKFLLTILNSIDDAVLVTNISGDITHINPRAEKITGFSHKEALSRNIDDVYIVKNEITQELIKDPISFVLETGTPKKPSNHTILISKTGEEFNISDSASPIKDRLGIILGVVLVFRDMTEIYRIREKMQNNVRLDSLGILAGGLAHDFNNLLGGIFGYMEIAKEYSLQGEDNLEFINSALSVLSRTRDLTQQLLTFSRGGVPNRAPTDIKSLIKKSTTFSLSGSSIDCEFNFCDEPVLCEIDKNQIGQVIDNIVINAKQALDKKGSIVISTVIRRLLEINELLLPPGEYINVSISDTGPGIPKSIIDKIFDPFFTTKKAGNGLGLATCHSIVKKHDGSLFVESELGKGTTFHIFLPIYRKQYSSNLIASLKDHKGDGRILIMDDESYLRDIFKHLLESLGYSIEVKTKGEEVLELLPEYSQQYFEEHKPPCPFLAIFLDLTVQGGLGGNDIITQLRRSYGMLPIFAMSGYSNDPIISTPEAYDFTGSLSKPFEKNDIIHLLNQYL